MPKKIHIEYFAILKDQSSLNSETIETDAATPSDLYQELKTHHSFSLEQDQLKVAINENFSNWDDELNDGDQIVFIPPVAGG